jgi:hypothetical protein
MPIKTRQAKDNRYASFTDIPFYLNKSVICRLQNNRAAITPHDMQASAKLNMGEKKMKCSPPKKGIHPGQFHSTKGK